jgi:hypothetical protein
MQKELEPGRYAEVAARAAKPPKQVRIVCLVRVNDASVWSHELGGDEVVGGQAMLCGEMADTAAQRQSADARRADNAAGRHKAINLRGRIEIGPG